MGKSPSYIADECSESEYLPKPIQRGTKMPLSLHLNHHTDTSCVYHAHSPLHKLLPSDSWLWWNHFVQPERHRSSVTCSAGGCGVFRNTVFSWLQHPFQE